TPRRWRPASIAAPRRAQSPPTQEASTIAHGGTVTEATPGREDLAEKASEFLLGVLAMIQFPRAARRTVRSIDARTRQATVLAVALGLGVILLWNQFVHNATGIDSDLASAATASTEAD